MPFLIVSSIKKTGSVRLPVCALGRGLGC